MKARGASGWGVGRGSRASPGHPYIPWWSRDPNKGGRRIKGGGAYCSGFRAGDQDLHQAVRGLCALDRSGELQPPAAPKSFSLRLLRGDKSSRVAPVSAPPALLRRPRLSRLLSLASRGECDDHWAPSGLGLGRHCSEERVKPSAPPRPGPEQGGA